MIKFADKVHTPKQRAQADILASLGSAWASVENDDDMTDREKALVLEQLDKQMSRIEKMFGYVPGSWMRGY